MSLSRFNAASGLGVGLVMAGGYVWGMRGMPSLDSAREIVAWYHDRGSTSLEVAGLLVTVAFFFTYWFFGVVMARLQKAEGAGPLTWIAFAGGLSFTTVFQAGLAMVLGIGLTLSKGVDVDAIYLMHVVSLATGVTTAVCGPVFFTPVAILAFTTGVFPRWLAWVTVVCAVGSVTPLLGAFSLSGPLNVGNGVVGIHTVAASWVGWCAVTSWWLLAQERAPRAAAPASTPELSGAA
jgi:hypothetical protein